MTQAKTDLKTLASDLDKVLARNLAFRQALDAIADVVQRHIGWYSIVLRAIDPNSSSFIAVYRNGPDELFKFMLPVHLAADSVAAKVVAAGQPLLLHSQDPETGMKSQGINQLLIDRGIRTQFLCPILDGGTAI